MTQNPADLPDYCHPTLDYLRPALKVLWDVYGGLYQCKDRYLPKASMEPPESYQRRVERSVFNNKTRPIIDSNAGLLTAFDVSGLPPTLEAAQEDVDLMGSSLISFVLDANIQGLRDKTCYVLTMQEPIPEGQPRTQADDLLNPRRPYWRIIDRRNVLNWRLSYEGGAPVIDQVTLLMHEAVPAGRFGTNAEPRYHVLTRDKGGITHEVFAITDKGEMTPTAPARAISISRIPLVAYPNPADPFPEGLPEFYKAAELNLKLFRQESTLDNIQYRVNAPTFWRRSRLGIGLDENGQPQRPPFIAGENYVIELMAADDIHGPDEVGVLEISGDGIAALQQSVAETKEDIEAESLGFLSGSAVQRTATEAYLSGAQMSSALNGKARQLSAALGRMVADWCLFTGEDPSEFAIQMDHSLLETPLDAQEMAQLLALRQAGEIDQRTFLELLRMGRQLPPSADIDEIIERVAAEFDQQTAPPLVPNGVVVAPPEDDPAAGVQLSEPPAT